MFPVNNTLVYYASFLITDRTMCLDSSIIMHLNQNDSLEVDVARRPIALKAFERVPDNQVIIITIDDVEHMTLYSML